MTTSALAERLTRRILVLDGALGTMLGSRGDDDAITRTQADRVRRLHDAYLEAGADIIRTNTFSSRAPDIAAAAVRLARAAADGWSTPDRRRFVAGVINPSPRIGPEHYRDLVNALTDDGVDLIILETVYDTGCGVGAATSVREALARRTLAVPLIVSAAINANGSIPSGERIEEVYERLRAVHPLAIGVNCGSGAAAMQAPLEWLATVADMYVTCHPSAGLPDADGRYRDGPEGFAEKLRAFARRGLLNIAGGCCGTTPDHIRALASALKEVPPRRLP